MNVLFFDLEIEPLIDQSCVVFVPFRIVIDKNINSHFSCDQTITI